MLAMRAMGDHGRCTTGNTSKLLFTFPVWERARIAGWFLA